VNKGEIGALGEKLIRDGMAKSILQVKSYSFALKIIKIYSQIIVDKKDYISSIKTAKSNLPQSKH
jgi:hypothetical protein